MASTFSTNRGKINSSVVRNNLNMKVRNKSIHSGIKRNKILRSKYNTRSTKMFVLQTLLKEIKEDF